MRKHLKKHLPLKPYYYGCPKCRNCCFTNESADYQPLCPTYHYYRSITLSGAGVNKLAANLFEGNVNLSREIADSVYKCTLCGGCDEQCPMSCRPTRTSLQLRCELIASGQRPPEPLYRLKEAILKAHNPFYKPPSERFEFLNGGGWGSSLVEAEYLLFTGCHIAYEQSGMATNAAKVLDKLNIRYSFFQGEQCCGYPLYQLGYKKEAEKQAKKQFAEIKKINKPILFLCPSCYYYFKTVRKDKLPALFFSELVDTRLTEKHLNGNHGGAVSYHDPCVLGRGSMVYDEPRNILKLASADRFVELSRSREMAWCCGAGYGVPAYEPEFTAWTANQRMDEAKDAGVQTLVTSCPKCKGNLEKNSEAEIQIKDLAEYLAEVLRPATSEVDLESNL